MNVRDAVLAAADAFERELGHRPTGLTLPGEDYDALVVELESSAAYEVDEATRRLPRHVFIGGIYIRRAESSPMTAEDEEHWKASVDDAFRHLVRLVGPKLAPPEDE